MNNEIERYTNGTMPVRRKDKAVATAAKAIYDEARITGMKQDAVCAVAGHLMETVTELDLLRRSIAKDDVALNLLLADIEHQAVRTCGRLQRDMFGWGG